MRLITRLFRPAPTKGTPYDATPNRTAFLLTKPRSTSRNRTDILLKRELQAGYALLSLLPYTSAGTWLCNSLCSKRRCSQASDTPLLAQTSTVPSRNTASSSFYVAYAATRLQPKTVNHSHCHHHYPAELEGMAVALVLSAVEVPEQLPAADQLALH